MSPSLRPPDRSPAARKPRSKPPFEAAGGAGAAFRAFADEADQAEGRRKRLSADLGSFLRRPDADLPNGPAMMETGAPKGGVLVRRAARRLDGRCPESPRFSSVSEAWSGRGWGTWIRTRTDGVRVRCSTVKLFPNGGWRVIYRVAGMRSRARGQKSGVGAGARIEGLSFAGRRAYLGGGGFCPPRARPKSWWPNFSRGSWLCDWPWPIAPGAHLVVQARED